MKRDLDLIRLLLLEQESGETPEAMSSYTEAQVLEHSVLAIEAGLLDGVLVHDEQGNAAGATLQRLTWAGHDFLDLARSETLWAKVKEEARKAGIGWTIEIAKGMLLYQAKRLLGLSENES